MKHEGNKRKPNSVEIICFRVQFLACGLSVQLYFFFCLNIFLIPNKYPIFGFVP